MTFSNGKKKILAILKKFLMISLYKKFKFTEDNVDISNILS